MTDFNTRPTTVDDASIWVGSCYMNLLDPNPSEIFLDDIALSLSRICRFNGHGNRFYSVAEHSVNCVVMARDWHGVSPISALRAILMHDALEAFIGDVTTPLKRHLSDYRRIEGPIQRAIEHRFGLESTKSAIVKLMDRKMLATEKLALHPDCPPWPDFPAEIAIPDFPIIGKCPEDAAEAFMSMAYELGVTHVG
ncbi:MAG: HD family hydrolase [Pseudomonadota bacterium]